jgi:hypothetical protein
MAVVDRNSNGLPDGPADLRCAGRLDFVRGQNIHLRIARDPVKMPLFVVVVFGSVLLALGSGLAGERPQAAGMPAGCTGRGRTVDEPFHAISKAALPTATMALCPRGAKAASKVARHTHRVLNDRKEASPLHKFRGRASRFGRARYPSPVRTARVVWSGPRSSTLSIASSSASRPRARLTRLLMVPIGHPQMTEASS